MSAVAGPHAPLRERLARATLWSAGGQLAAQGASFVRNVIVAREVSPDHFGVAATFALSVALVEMSSTLSTDQMVVQSERGDEPALLRTAQLVELARGAFGALAIWLLADPLAAAFGEPRAAWAFRWLAFVPLCHGVMNLDPKRMQRGFAFGPATWVEALPSLASAAAAWPVARALGDYSAMLWLLLGQAGLQVVVSHVVATRRFGLAWHREHLRAIAAFGWPLLVNGVLMFGITQGDRMVIGTSERLFGRPAFSLADLGVYSVAFGLTQIPSMMVAHVSARLLLPLFAHAPSADERVRRYALAAGVASLVAGAFGIAFLLVGPALVTTVYGANYAAAGAFIGVLGLMQCLRIVRSVPTVAAIAGADTRAPMLANLVRSSALLGVLFAAYEGWGMTAIAVAGLGGELLAHGYALVRARDVQGVAVATALRPHALVLPGVLGALWLAQLLPGDAWLARAGSAVALCVAIAALLLVASPELRRIARVAGSLAATAASGASRGSGGAA